MNGHYTDEEREIEFVSIELLHTSIIKRFICSDIRLQIILQFYGLQVIVNTKLQMQMWPNEHYAS